MVLLSYSFVFFFFNDTATTEIYTLSLHDALPISRIWPLGTCGVTEELAKMPRDRKSTRLNSSHTVISYAVFCLKKKKNRVKPLLCVNTNIYRPENTQQKINN